MRILVTGREGQIARSLAERSSGHELIFAGRPKLDLADFASIERTVADICPDLVISAAAYTAVDEAEDNSDLAMRINGEAAGVLARAAARWGAAIIHLSTDYVFDGSLDRPWREDDRTSPLGAYGKSKLAGEKAIAASGAAYAIIRTAWVYSPFGSNFVKTMLRLATERNRLAVVEDQFGNPTSALEIAAALLAIANVWEMSGECGINSIFHFAGVGDTNWAAFAREIFAQSAARGGPAAEVEGIQTSGYPTKAIRPLNSRLDCTRFAAVFGFTASPWKHSLTDVISRLLPTS